jgi:signal transduction histidine kinase
VKISRGPLSDIVIISWNKGFHPGTTAFMERNAPGEKTHLREWWMNQSWKQIFVLDFEKSFLISSAKLLLVWNPLWTLIVTLISGNRTLPSICFIWGWNYLKATLVCFLGLAVIRLVVFVEKNLMARSARTPPRHGTGWYLLFLGFLAFPSLYVALHLMVAWINLFYAGDPMIPTFQWQYYGIQTFWVCALLLLSFLFKYWQDLRDAAQLGKMRAEELEKERLQAALSKLKDQMNPHFLFNTLNTVAALIPADPAKAEEVVVKLSTLFQGILEATRKTGHSLQKELEFCMDYLSIEKARFGPRLVSEIEIEKGLDPAGVQVPVLLLQPLVENAVKHGLSSRASGGKVWIKAAIRADRLEIKVEDDGVGFGNSPYAGSGTALDNCRKRLELGFGKEGKMEIAAREEGGTRILLSMPVLTADPD